MTSTTPAPEFTRLVVGADWDDAPHLSEDTKAALLGGYQEFEKDARSKGIPQLGSGAVYPFAESAIRVPDFDIRAFPHYRHAFGLDCALSGVTSVVWGALDPASQVLYIWSCYRQRGGSTVVHADAIKTRAKSWGGDRSGTWIPGAADAAGIVDADRTQFITQYRQHGFTIDLPDKEVYSGVNSVYTRLQAGTLKIFASCVAIFEEYRLYQRDKHGRIVKENDHLLDALRYLVHSGLAMAKTPPPVKDISHYRQHDSGHGHPLAWMD